MRCEVSHDLHRLLTAGAIGMHIMWVLSEQGGYGVGACCSSRVVGNIRGSKRIRLLLFLLVGVLIRVLSSSYCVSRYKLLQQSCFNAFQAIRSTVPQPRKKLSKHANLATAQHRLQFERIINIPFSWLGLWLHSACTQPCKSFQTFLSACWWCNTSSAVEIGGSGYETSKIGGQAGWVSKLCATNASHTSSKGLY